MDKIGMIETDGLSKYKTHHIFKHYGEFSSIEEYLEFLQWADRNKTDLYILGNGSNTLFVKEEIETLILKNKLPKEIKPLSEDRYEVSSNVMMHEMLNHCLKNSLDSFYYLASVPATIGGALAMNAGRGKENNQSIYDFVESVTYVDTEGTVKTAKASDVVQGYRHTVFTGVQKKLIVSAVFRFPRLDADVPSPIKERIKWAKEKQDNVVPNCGSVFKVSWSPLMRRIKGLRIGSAYFSGKTTNWINNTSRSPRQILSLIWIIKLLHALLGKKTVLELIKVK